MSFVVLPIDDFLWVVSSQVFQKAGTFGAPGNTEDEDKRQVKGEMENVCMTTQQGLGR